MPSPENSRGALHPPSQLTDTEIISLAQNHHHFNPVSSQLPPFLLAESSHPILLSFLHSRAAAAADSSTAVSDYVSSLISLISHHPCPALSSLLPAVLHAYLSLFTSHKIPHDRNSLSIIQQFAGHLDAIEIRKILEVIDLVVSYFPQISDLDDAQVLILLPKCIGLVRISSEIDKPVEYVNSVIDAVIECDWSNVLLIKLVQSIRDFASCIDKVRKREFLQKIFEKMREDVEMQDLPGLVYQLLVLAAKGFGKRGVKQDPSLGLEVLGLVRLDSRAFNHFTVTVLLSVARIRRFSDSAIDILKTALFNAYKDYKFAKVCRWLPNELKEEYLENARVIEKAILKSVNGSHYGREHIVPSIVQLGFGLLHAVEEGAQKDISKFDGLMGTEELEHGTELITFQIIEQCKYHVLSMKPEKCFPITRISSNLVTVLLPLMKFSRNLQVYTILVLRKAMFRRENSVRLAACSAIFDLLSAEKQSKSVGLFSFQESSSQASCSQQAEEPHATRADLFQQLSGLLQRCLYQQANVRENVYHGIMKLAVVDPLSSGTIFDLLLSHFQRFYKENEELQLGIDQCVKLENGKFCIEEPLDCLLFCASWILLLQPQNRSDHSSESLPCFGFSISQDNVAGRNFSGVSFSNALSQIRKFLRNGNLEGMLGKKQDSSSTPIEEEKKEVFCYTFIRDY
ncbi:Fanconi anemia group I protein [Salvia divinorum]|uniref:Fanconi anemia group I protein n=1 Tax=Salvia divinorum TaxID=28513 RepID=A0ABD1GWJ7_SALDI